MKKVLLYTHFFPPETGAASIRIHYFYKVLKNAGYNLSVVRPQPNYPLNKKIEEVKKEENIFTIPIFIPEKDSVLKRFFSYASFSISSALFVLFKRFNSEVIISSSPPIFTAFSAAIVSKIKRTKFIFDIRDVWPDIGIELGILKHGITTKILSLIEMFILNASTKVIVTAKGDKKNLIAKGVSSDKIEIIYNGADTEIFKPLTEAEIKKLREKYNLPQNKNLIVYFGSYNYGMNDIEILPEILNQLSNEIEFHFVSIGSGSGLKKVIEKISNNVDYTIFKAVDSKTISEIVASCDLSIIPRKFISNDTGGNIPVKCFESWACGIPVVLSTIDNCELAQIFDRSNAGIRVIPENPKEFVDAIKKILLSDLKTKYGANGRDYVVKNFDRTKQSEQIIKIVEEITNER